MRQLVIIYGNKLIGYLDETGMVENVPFKIIAQGTYDPEGDQEDKDFEAREQQAKIVYDQAHNAAKMKYKEKFEEATASIDLATVDTRDLDRLTREVNDAAQYEATEIFKKDGKKAAPKSKKPRAGKRPSRPPTGQVVTSSDGLAPPKRR